MVVVVAVEGMYWGKHHSCDLRVSVGRFLRATPSVHVCMAWHGLQHLWRRAYFFPSDEGWATGAAADLTPARNSSFPVRPPLSRKDKQCR